MAEHLPSKGRAPDLPFPATVVSANRRRCRLTTLERAAAAWCNEQGISKTARERGSRLPHAKAGTQVDD